MLSNNHMKIFSVYIRIKISATCIGPGLVLRMKIGGNESSPRRTAIIGIELGRNTKIIKAGEEIY